MRTAAAVSLRRDTVALSPGPAALAANEGNVGRDAGHATSSTWRDDLHALARHDEPFTHSRAELSVVASLTRPVARRSLLRGLGATSGSVDQLAEDVGRHRESGGCTGTSSIAGREKTA